MTRTNVRHRNAVVLGVAVIVAAVVAAGGASDASAACTQYAPLLYVGSCPGTKGALSTSTYSTPSTNIRTSNSADINPNPYGDACYQLYYQPKAAQDPFVFCGTYGSEGGVAGYRYSNCQRTSGFFPPYNGDCVTTY